MGGVKNTQESAVPCDPAGAAMASPSLHWPCHLPSYVAQ